MSATRTERRPSRRRAAQRGSTGADRRTVGGRRGRRATSMPCSPTSSASATSTSSSRSGPARTSRTTASAPRARPRRPSGGARPPIARELLPALDNLERALRARSGDRPASAGADHRAGRGGEPPSEEVSAQEALARGVALVYGELRAALERAGVETYDPTGEQFDPNAARGARRPPGRGRRRARGGDRDAREGLPPRRPGAEGGARRRERVGGAMADRDLYSVLGVSQQGERRRDQEGVPQAGAQVPPRPQPGRRRGRGALQGGPGGLRHALRPREAQAVRRRRDVLRLRAAAASAAGRLHVRPRRHLLDRLRAPRRPRARRTARGRDLETEVQLSFEQAMDGTEVARHGAEAGHLRDLRRQRGQARHLADHLPALRRDAASTPRARASSRSASPARGAAGAARSSRAPARPAAAPA